MRLDMKIRLFEAGKDPFIPASEDEAKKRRHDAYGDKKLCPVCGTGSYDYLRLEQKFCATIMGESNGEDNEIYWDWDMGYTDLQDWIDNMLTAEEGSSPTIVGCTECM